MREAEREGTGREGKKWKVRRETGGEGREEGQEDLGGKKGRDE